VKLFLKLLFSVALGAACVFVAFRHTDWHAVQMAMGGLSAATVVSFFGLMAVAHLFRCWRWEYLLRPMGTSVSFAKLVPISSVGFMAILALPVRLGEFVRPYLVSREGHTKMSAALGTVAVERIVDGLLISIVFFSSYVLSGAGGSFSTELRWAAWLSLLGFGVLTFFLACALRWPQATIRLGLRLTLIAWLAPRAAARLAARIETVITGFRVLAHGRYLAIFIAQSALYWVATGLGLWVLARGMALPLSPWAAFTIMSFTGVVLTLPNSPGLVGQFHLAIRLGLSAYFPLSVVNGQGAAYGIVLHAFQTLWYVALGLVCLPLLPASGGLRATLQASNRAAVEPASEVVG